MIAIWELTAKRQGGRKADVRLPGKGNSKSHGARPVPLIITMIKWIRTSTLSTKNSLPLLLLHAVASAACGESLGSLLNEVEFCRERVSI